VVWEVARSLWINARDRVNETLSERERRDFARIVRSGRGRPWNLSSTDRRRLVSLLKKAATGDTDSSWEAVGRSVVTLLPPRILAAIWERRGSRRWVLDSSRGLPGTRDDTSRRKLWIHQKRRSTMRSKGRDKTGGTLDKVRGRMKEAGGALTGNQRRKARGQDRQLKGSARKKRGHLRDLLRK
jgi:uncharacterized protein YjbJ (UPF0337 family)